MAKSKVVLLRAETYDEQRIYEKLKNGLEMLGGPEAFFSPGERIFLKLNLLRDADPRKAITTHPAVAAAFARLLSEAGFGNLSAGDSSGFGSAVKIMTDLGLREPFERYGVRMAECKEGIRVQNPAGIHAKEFVLAEEFTQTEALVSLSKMKTHALEYITGAVKNQYGCVAGLNKAKGHTQYPSQESFARMLVDLNRMLQPRLYVMDGITAMEGNGPASGSPVQMNVLLISSDPVALDSVFCRLIHLEPETVPTNLFGKQMGLGTYLAEEIEILTEEGVQSMESVVQRFGKPDFDVIRTRHTSKGIMGFLTNLRRFQRRPKIDPDRCRKCGVCVNACPVEGKAVAFAKGKDHPPVYDYKKCIRCFCCQEMCPYQAISVKGRSR